MLLFYFFSDWYTDDTHIQTYIHTSIHAYIYININADRSMTIAQKHIMTQNWTWHNHNTSQPNIHPSVKGWNLYILQATLFFSEASDTLLFTWKTALQGKRLTNGYCKISRIATNIETFFPFKPFSLEVLQTWIFTKLIQNLGKQTIENMKR